MTGVLLATILGSASDAAADTLTLKDGRIVEGTILNESTENGVRGLFFVDRFGITFLPNSKIAKRTKGRDLDAQIRERLAALKKDDFENRAKLAAWMARVGRDDDARALAQSIVAVDPENAVAHQVLGHERFRGKWMTPSAAKKAQGLEQHGDRWYTAEEWKVAQADERDAAEKAERDAAAKAQRDKVQQLARLMLSPHEATRARAESALSALATETKSKHLAALIERVKDYRRTLDEVRVKAAASRAASGGGGSGTGYALTELRVAMSKLKRPIRVFRTALASSAGASPVSIQLPELSVIKVNTTALIPITVD